MAKVEYYDMSVMIYCMNALIKRHQTDKELISWWNDAIGNMQSTMRKMDRTPEETANALAFIAKLTEQAENNENLKEVCENFVEKLREDSIDTEMLPPQTKERKRLNRLSLVSRHISAIVIAIVIAVPVVLLITNFDDIIEFFSGEERITYIEVDAVVYSSIEEFEESHNVTLLVPTWLPRGLAVVELEYSELGVDITYTDSVAQLTIEFDTIIPNTDGAESYERNGIVFYISQEASVIWWEYGENFYRLNFEFDISEYVSTIIKSIK
jgi:cytochrome c-type biogenesis protein CcmE